ncbi:MAG: OadG family protein [Bacillota bacterium]
MEEFDFAIQVMVIGFSVVLFTLFALYCIMLVFTRIFYKTGDKKTAGKPLVTPADSRSDSGKGINQRTAAVITAAVYNYLQLESSHHQGKIISIAVQPTGNSSGSSWQVAGRKSLLENKLELENIRRKKLLENI